MNTEYQPTIIETGLLIERLAIQFAFAREELQRLWIDFKRNPIEFLTCLRETRGQQLRNFLSTPYVIRAISTAITVVFCIVITALVIDRMGWKRVNVVANIEEPPLGIVLLNPQRPIGDLGIGLNGTGRVGFQSAGKGEGSGPTPQHAQGGGGGGDRTLLPQQVGELPLPSKIPAAIPIAPPVNTPVLPAAGIDIDPALWQDLKEPVYGDPLSQSQIPSKGPGTREGIGTKSGTGSGDGDGPGYGPGSGGNMGDLKKQIGYGGGGGSLGGGYANHDNGGIGGGGGEGFVQRARVLLKPEPQYTEDARKNQITGTVVLKVVFASSGEVVQIRALRTLPFGLTERAIAAARQIRFEPAMRDGRAVSVAMQLEYNFNLY